jgi:hypothetical protein
MKTPARYATRLGFFLPCTDVCAKGEGAKKIASFVARNRRERGNIAADDTAC